MEQTLPVSMARELKHLLGHRFLRSPEERVLNSYDAMNTPYLPDAVAEPISEGEVIAIVQACVRHRVPIVPRGAGCGFSGGALPVSGGIVLNMSRMSNLHIDAANLVAEVEPGVVTESIDKAAAVHGLFYPPDPASLKVSSIGGNIAENAGGPRAVKYGVTGDYVLALRVVLMNGSIHTFGTPLRKDVAGYNLAPLFVGSEGTLGIITRAWLKLLPRPKGTLSAMLLFPDAHGAARTITSVIAAGLSPSRLEIMDKFCITALREAGHDINSDAGAVLMVEVDGTPDSLPELLDQIRQLAVGEGMTAARTAASAADNEAIWELRRSLSPIINTFGNTKMNEDVVVPPTRIPDLFAFVEQLRIDTGLTIVCFGHAGDGNIHVNLMFDREAPGIPEKVEAVLHQLFTTVVKMGGSISGEHGIGIAKQRFMNHQFTAEHLQLMRDIKDVFDPLHLLNPGKILPERESPS